jgi:outer membrane biosynthesis protein TonB
MPKATPKLEPEPMDIPKMAAEQERAAEPKRAAEQKEQPEEKEEYEETITFRASDVIALQDTLEDIRFQIANIQRDARQDRLETLDLLRAILDRLPPAP